MLSLSDFIVLNAEPDRWSESLNAVTSVLKRAPLRMPQVDEVLQVEMELREKELAGQADVAKCTAF